MIKYLILFIHLVGFSFYQLIFGDVTVSQSIPSSLNSGEEVVVEVIVKKEGVGGFAKVQQTLPNGFIAEVIESKGATFSFKDNIVKFIWMALPSDNEFKVTYKLKATESVEGDFSISGKFSYIDENERKNIEIPASSINVKKTNNTNEVIAETVDESKQEDMTSSNGEIISDEGNTQEVIVEEITTENTVEEVQLKNVNISCNRTIVKTSENEFDVLVKFNQENLEGFAKISEIIPSGFEASAIETKGGVFSFKDNEVKILWMSAPLDKEFEISYKINALDASSNSYEIKGSLSYLENDITKKYEIASSNFEYEKQIEDVKEEVAEVVETIDESEVIEESKEKVSPSIEEKNEELVEVTEDKTNKITSIPNPETGISFKVQVGAGHKKVSSNYFSNKFNLKEVVSTESHQGWIKYIVGNFNDYKSARDKRNSIRNKIKSAFVTAYNKGERITVQEALMIANQKWYK